MTELYALRHYYGANLSQLDERHGEKKREDTGERGERRKDADRRAIEGEEVNG